MKIIEVRMNLTKEQIEEDMPQLLKAHEKALKEEPTWAFFGGVIILDNGHEYQIA